MTASFFSRLKQIDDLVAAGPDEVRIRNALAHLLLEPASRMYFLKVLATADWIAPLRRAGFFVSAASDAWPEVRYLARMSALDPETVRDIILAMPDTDNIWVLDDLIKAASAMPAEVAKNLVPRILSWFDKPVMPYSTEPLGELAVRLAEGGHAESALTLARSLLEIRLDLRSSFSDHVVPRRMADTWHYEQVVADAVPRLVAALGEPAFVMLCDLLESAVCMSSKSEKNTPGEDYSYIWHEAVESDRDSRFGDVRNLLVCAVRDAAVCLIHERQAGATAVVRTLESRKWSVFRRIALHVLRVSPHPPGSMVARRLLRRRHFDRIGMQDHEYTLLLRDRFQLLPEKAKHTILGWIDAGPDVERYVRRCKRHKEAVPDPAEISEYVEQWTLDRLALIAEHITGNWKRRYVGLRRRIEPERLDSAYPRIRTEWVPTRSPLSPEDLAAMPAADLATYLNGFQPVNDHFNNSEEGLKRALEAAVAQSPDRFAREVMVFSDLRKPGFVTAVLDGFRSAVDKKARLRWRPLLGFCTWVVGDHAVPQEPPARKKPSEGSWSEAKHTVVDLLNKAFQNPAHLDIRLRKLVWSVIEPVTREPDLTREAEENQDSDTGDWITSTVRSTALECVIRYAEWVEDRTCSRAREKCFDLSLVPEVRDVLDHHVDPHGDRSLAVRQMLGIFFPTLIRLDTEWAEQKVCCVFPHREEHVRLFAASWNAYLKFCRPYSSVLPVLADTYRYAVETLPLRAATDKGYGPSDDRLAQHLMTYYWWARIGLDEDGLLNTLFARASDKLRAVALEFAGRSAGKWGRPVPGDVMQRLVRLWEWRKAEIAAAPDSARHAAELAAFGWWFISGKFPRKWALAQLHSAIQLGGWAEPELQLVERLAAYMTTQPDIVLDCLDRLFRTAVAGGGWGANVLLKPAHKLLELALGIRRVRERAWNMINSFGAAGYIEKLRDLADTYMREEAGDDESGSPVH